MSGILGSLDISMEERQEIEKLLGLKYKIGQIAAILGRSHSGIKNEINRNGGRIGYTAEKAQYRADGVKESKKRKLRKNITGEQIKVIEEGIQNNWSIHQMALSSGVHDKRISDYLKENGIKYQRKNYAGIEERIASLEMQMEIIIEQLKEIYERNAKD